MQEHICTDCCEGCPLYRTCHSDIIAMPGTETEPAQEPVTEEEIAAAIHHIEVLVA